MVIGSADCEISNIDGLQVEHSSKIDKQQSKLTMPPFLVLFLGALYLTLTKFDHAASWIVGQPQTGNKDEKGDWLSILSSIESRLKNLDTLYTSQLTPTLESRFEHFQNRISGMEIKLLRIEALLTTKLDRMSDNISSRHFRDDMVQTDLFRKVETAYDGITHKLVYLDRKYDNSFLKTQGKMEVILKTLGNTDESLVTRFDSIDSQISDFASDVEETKTVCGNLQKTALCSMDRSANVSQQKIVHMPESPNNSSSTPTTVLNIFGVDDSEDSPISNSNGTEKAIDQLRRDLETLLNDYAIKVSDLGEQVSMADDKISARLDAIENVTISTKSELLNGFSTLFVQMGKTINDQEDQYEVVEKTTLSRLEEKLKTEFEKILLVHNQFFERCDRLQLDDSQMETKLSEILNKLIDNYEKTTRDQRNLLKKVESSIVSHDSNSKRDLYQVHTNMVAVYEQSKKDAILLSGQMKQILDNVEALFALIDKNFGYYPIAKRETRRHAELFEYILSLERALNFTKMEQMEMYDSYQATINTLMTVAESNAQDNKLTTSIVTNITGNLENLKEKLNVLTKNWNKNTTSNILTSVKQTYQLVKENNKQLGKMSDILKKSTDKNNRKMPETSNNSNNTQTTKDQSSTKAIDKLIQEIFFNSSTAPSVEENTAPCLDFDIDVRFEGNKSTICKNQTENNITKTDSLRFNMDVRFAQDENSTSTTPRKHEKDNNTNEETSTQFYENLELSEETTSADNDVINLPLVGRFDQTQTNMNQTLNILKLRGESQPITQNSEHQNINSPSAVRENISTLINEIISSTDVRNSTEYIKLDVP